MALLIEVEHPQARTVAMTLSGGGSQDIARAFLEHDLFPSACVERLKDTNESMLNCGEDCECLAAEWSIE